MLDLHLQTPVHTPSRPPLFLFFCHPYGASLWSVSLHLFDSLVSFSASLSPYVFYLMVSHQTNPDVLLTGILALTLPVASETCEQAPGLVGLGKPSSTLTPLLAPQTGNFRAAPNTG